MTTVNLTSSKDGIKEVYNIGKYSIDGVDLLTKGKYKTIVYYLNDINSLVVYETTEFGDAWFNALGIPCAGSLTLREQLVPFEGQRYYVVEQDIAYEYVGGSWEGTVFEGNTVSPRVLVLGSPAELTIGREHVLRASGDYPIDQTFIKEGHSITFMAEVPSCNIVFSQDTSYVIDGVVVDAPSGTLLTIENCVLYSMVYQGDRWLISYTSRLKWLSKSSNLSDVPNKEAARANLDVLAASEVDEVADAAVDGISIGTGLVKTGTSAKDDMELTVAFATVEEAADINVDDKALSPSTAATVIQATSEVSQFNNLTGVLPVEGEPKFAVTGVAGGTVFNYNAVRVVFNLEPYTRTEDLVIVNLVAGTAPVLNTPAVSVQYLVVNSSGTVSVSLTKPSGNTNSEALLGTCIALAGQIVSTSGGAAIQSQPWLSSSDFAIRNSSPTVSGGSVTPSVTQGKITVGTYIGFLEGLNWDVSTTTPHTREIPEQVDAVFSTFDRNGDVINPATDLIDGSELDDGTPVANNDYSIQLLYLTVEGNIIVLIGQESYPDLATARSEVFTYQPIVPAILGNAIAAIRMVVKGDQEPGSPSYDLANSTNFQVFQLNGVGVGSSGSSSASEISASTANNNLQSTNLQTQLDQLSARTATKLVTAGGVISLDYLNILDYLGSKPLPSVVDGQIIGLLNKGAEVGVSVEVNDVNTEVLFFNSDIANTGTVLEIDTGGVFWLLGESNKWRILNA